MAHIAAAARSPAIRLASGSTAGKQHHALSGDRLTLALPGSGPIENELHQLIRKLGLENSVILPGFRNDVRQLVGCADIVALPSEREGLSLALLEAMAAGKPIVATSIGSNVEATDNGRAALLVPPRNADALRKALSELLADHSRARGLGSRARHLFLERYTEEGMLARYMALYASLNPEE